MRRALVGCALLACGGLALAAWTYVASERHLHAFAAPVRFTVPIPLDSAEIVRGEHLVTTRGCRGCHGAKLEGAVMWGNAVAPNLAAYAREESPATIEAALRHGIGRDGRALYSMPSYNFIRLRDADVAAIIAYLRSAPVVTSTLPHPSLPWRIRWDMARGTDAAMPAYLDQVPPLRRSDDPDSRIARGEYLAMTTCIECHGFNLRGDTPWEGPGAPDLAIISAYDTTAFRRLMREGVAVGGRELPMMSPVARGRFAALTSDEVGDLYAFLVDLSRRR